MVYLGCSLGSHNKGPPATIEDHEQHCELKTKIWNYTLHTLEIFKRRAKLCVGQADYGMSMRHIVKNSNF